MLALIDSGRGSSRATWMLQTSKPKDERSLGKSHSGDSCRAAAAAMVTIRDSASHTGQEMDQFGWMLIDLLSTDEGLFGLNLPHRANQAGTLATARCQGFWRYFLFRLLPDEVVSRPIEHGRAGNSGRPGSTSALWEWEWVWWRSVRAFRASSPIVGNCEVVAVRRLIRA